MRETLLIWWVQTLPFDTSGKTTMKHNRNTAVVAWSALFKECHFIPKKEQKWHFHPQIKNILLHILPVAKLCKSLKIFPAQPYPVEFQKSSVTTWAYHFEAVNGSWLVFSRAKVEFAHNWQLTSLSCFRWFVGDKELFLYFKEPKEHFSSPTLH